MATKEQVISNFAKQTGKHSKGSLCDYNMYNIFYEDRILYSYGYHFPLVVKAPDAENGFGAEVGYIINGDKYSVSTSKHQNECIRGLKGNVQIPFSALQEAWNWAQEENWRKCHSFHALAMALMKEDGTFQVVAWNKDEWRHTHDDGKTWYPGHFHGWLDVEAGLNCTACDLVVDKEPEDTPTSQHRLGAVLFKIRENYFLSSFDELDRGNYFLCHVPGSPGTVEEAYEALKPTEVRDAESQGIKLLRQGDWFFKEPFVDLTLPFWKKELRAAPVDKSYRLGGTSGTHMVTEMRDLGSQGGIGMPTKKFLVVKGCVRHSPLDGRRPEHKRLKLGDGKSWWIPVKNTSEAGWGAVGNVD